MSYIPLTELAQQQVAQLLQPGQLAVDATVGNGHDTIFLAAQVGAKGRVFGFDIQQLAITQTQRKLADAGLEQQVTLLLAGHEQMSTHIPPMAQGRVAAVMFNLGYLPGSDKRTVTRPDTTAAAIHSAIKLLAPGGIISLLVYRGHAGARAEADAVARVVEGLDSRLFEISRFSSPGPVLLIIRKNPSPVDPGTESITHPAAGAALT